MKDKGLSMKAKMHMATEGAHSEVEEYKKRKKLHSKKLHKHSGK